MNTDAIDKLLEQIDTAEHGHLRDIIYKLFLARAEIERLRADCARYKNRQKGLTQ